MLDNSEVKNLKPPALCSKKMGFCLIPFVTSLSKASFGILLFVFSLSCSRFSSTEAYDALDPNGNITIRWDVISWTPDGYVALVTINNYQQYRHIEAPGWSLGWTWAKKEVIWNMIGAHATEQGNCSNFTGNIIPHSCKKNPTIVDLFPSTPYNQQIPNCCKGGVLSSWAQDPANAVAAFQITVGKAGTTNRTVRIPKNITLNGPGLGYTCGPAKIVRPTRFITPDKRRVTLAAMTWNVTCTYLQFLVQKNPTCCVSLSTFYNDTIVPCPKCSCGCRGNSSTCAKLYASPHLIPLVQCTNHMCPIQVHWHVQDYHMDYWRVKINISNFNYRMNYPEWNLVIQHPNVDKMTNLSGYIYRGLTPNGAINDTAIIWGSKGHNDVLNQAGNVEAELIIGNGDESNMTLEKGWAFPEAIYFNGDKCVMPPSHAYSLTLLPANISTSASSNSSSSSAFRQEVSLLTLIMYYSVALVFYKFT